MSKPVEKAFWRITDIELEEAIASAHEAGLSPRQMLVVRKNPGSEERMGPSTGLLNQRADFRKYCGSFSMRACRAGHPNFDILQMLKGLFCL